MAAGYLPKWEKVFFAKYGAIYLSFIMKSKVKNNLVNLHRLFLNFINLYSYVFYDAVLIYHMNNVHMNSLCHQDEKIDENLFYNLPIIGEMSVLIFSTYWYVFAM